MHEEQLPNPWKGVPGFWARVSRLVYPIAGPAQVGIGRPEEPYRPPADPRALARSRPSGRFTPCTRTFFVAAT